VAAIVVTVLVGAAVPAGTTETAARKPGCGRGKSGVPVPQDARATRFLQGNSSPPLPAGEPKKLAVLAVGPQRLPGAAGASASLPIVVRNNTCTTVTSIEIGATIRGPNRQIVATAETHPAGAAFGGTEPVTLGPGQVGIGMLLLDHTGATLPEGGATFEYTITSKKAKGQDRDPYVSAAILESSANLVDFANGTHSWSFAGTLKNVQKRKQSTPFFVLAMCFDESGVPITSNRAPVTGTSFYVSTIGNMSCPAYLVGASRLQG